MIQRFTVVGEHQLPDHLLADTRTALVHLNWLGLAEERAETRGLHVHHFRGTVPPVTFAHAGHDHAQMLRDLTSGWHTLGVAAGVVRGPLATTPPRLVVTDVDSTLIPVEVIELIAARAGIEAEVEAITSAAMRGELDFAASLAQRVGMLAGVPAAALTEIAEGIRFSPGATELVRAVQATGGRICAVSGGFHEVVDPLASRLGLDRALANRLSLDDDGAHLGGTTTGEVVDGSVKERMLEQWRGEFGGPAVAIGDGANDLAMLAAADLGIAYCAKPVVAAAADAAIPFPRLDAALPLMGL
ncbi:MAG: phosphoserine phosphatase SerB [bacterium]|nr:phosphoserine phosphatase SerB [bacterium]